MNHTTLFPLALSALAATVVCVACTSAPESTARQRVESPQLGIAIAELPAPFELSKNAAADLELIAPGAGGPGTLTIETGPEGQTGINLVAEAETSRTWFEAQPEGRFFGNLELVTPLGSAFTARGSYRLEGVVVEELRVFALHPVAYRLLRLTYQYPPGEGQERMQQLAELLGEVEALAKTDQEASSVEGTS